MIRRIVYLLSKFRSLNDAIHYYSAFLSNSQIYRNINHNCRTWKISFALHRKDLELTRVYLTLFNGLHVFHLFIYFHHSWLFLRLEKKGNWKLYWKLHYCNLTNDAVCTTANENILAATKCKVILIWITRFIF